MCGVAHTGSFLFVCHRKNAEHTARPKMKAVITNRVSLIVDTDANPLDDFLCSLRLAAVMVQLRVLRPKSVSYSTLSGV